MTRVWYDGGLGFRPCAVRTGSPPGVTRCSTLVVRPGRLIAGGGLRARARGPLGAVLKGISSVLSMVYCPDCVVSGMRQAFHAELDELISGLVKLARRVGRMMTGASTALWHADFRLAESITCGQSKVTTALCDDIERRCVRLLVLQAPVATDLRVVVAVLGAVSDVVRMGKLGGHIATGIPSCRRRRDRYPVPR